MTPPGTPFELEKMDAILPEIGGEEPFVEVVKALSM